MKKEVKFLRYCLLILFLSIAKIERIFAADSDDKIFGIFPDFSQIFRHSLRKTFNFPSRIWFSMIRFFNHSKVAIGWTLLVGIPVIAIIILIVYLIKKSNAPALPSYQSFEPIQKNPQPLPPEPFVGAMLYVTQADGTRQDIPMIYNSNVIGRNPMCQICLNDNLVSDQHAEIYIQDGRYFVRDLGSSNGTFVNGYLIEGIVELFSGYYVQMGTSTIQL